MVDLRRTGLHVAVDASIGIVTQHFFAHRLREGLTRSLAARGAGLDRWVTLTAFFCGKARTLFDLLSGRVPQAVSRPRRGHPDHIAPMRNAAVPIWCSMRSPGSVAGAMGSSNSAR